MFVLVNLLIVWFDFNFFCLVVKIDLNGLELDGGMEDDEGFNWF